MHYNELISTLQNLIKYKPSQQQLADILNIRQTAISGRAQRNSEFSEEEIQKIENAFNVSLTNSNNDIDGYYYPDIFGSCGGGSFILSEVKEPVKIPITLISHFSKNKTYSIINAIGDSMTPTINNKDKLIVEHCENEQIKDNQVYIFCYNNEIYVKRLVKNIDEIIVKSDNLDPIYRPRIIEKEDMNNIYIIGEIVGLMRNFK